MPNIVFLVAAPIIILIMLLTLTQEISPIIGFGLMVVVLFALVGLNRLSERSDK